MMKLKFSIKNLRERLAKGLVDKGVLGTESQSFGLFEMATHPLKDASVKVTTSGGYHSNSNARAEMRIKKKKDEGKCMYKHENDNQKNGWSFFQMF